MIQTDKRTNTKKLSALDIKAIYSLLSSNYEYIAARKTHQGGRIEGRYFDSYSDLVELQTSIDVYDKSQTIMLLEEMIDVKDDKEKWRILLDNVKSCEKWTSDKVIRDIAEALNSGNLCDLIESEKEVYESLYTRDYQCGVTASIEDAINSIALYATGKKSEIFDVDLLIDVALENQNTEIDSEDWVEVAYDYIADNCDWSNETLFYRADIEEDWEHLYIINPKIAKSAIEKINKMKDYISFKPIDKVYVEDIGNVIYLNRDAFESWDDCANFEDIENIIAKHYKEI